jgi:RNA ligase
MNNLKFTPDLAAKLLELKLIRKQVHPTLPLTIWNYTQSAQYRNAWDEYPILLHLRGLITENRSYDIIARPFKKFFNIEENRHSPTKSFKIQEKMDGSLGICFWYNSAWHMATRGSFTSDQAIKGRELLNKYDAATGMIPGYTYLFEIIYPENRICVDYKGEEKLVVLGVIHTSSGKECNFKEMESEGFEVVNEYPFTPDLQRLKMRIPNDKEGYVVVFENGDRCKIKGEEYCRLHRLMTNVTTYSVYDALLNNAPIESIVDELPDEMFEDVREFIDNVLEKQTEIYKECYDNLITILSNHGNAAPHYHKKFVALDIQQTKYPKYAFSLLNDTTPDHIKTKLLILKGLKPKYRKF